MLYLVIYYVFFIISVSTGRSLILKMGVTVLYPMYKTQLFFSTRKNLGTYQKMT
jgi:hypothetical protein